MSTSNIESAHFNKLTPVQAELLALLAEECGELVQAIGKILRHGLDSYHPDSGIGNQESLEKEMGDVRAAMILLCDAKIAHKANVHTFADDKRCRVIPYLHHFRFQSLEDGQ